MSSILDALNKLEEEKKEAARTAAEAAIDPRVAARELVGRTAPRRTSQGNPLVWGLAGIALFFMVTLGAAVAVYFMLRPNMPTPALAAAVSAEIPTAPPPVADAAVVANVDATPGTPEVAEPPKQAATTSEEKTEASVEPTPAAAAVPDPSAPPAQPEVSPEPKAMPVQEPETTVKPFEVASNPLPELGWGGPSAVAVEPVDESPAVTEVDVQSPALPQAPVVETSPLPAPLPERMAPAPSPAPKSSALPSDISKLPVLRESDKPRIGFEDIDINMLQPKSANRPYARAIINLKPVMINETIPGTRATLIGVEMKGIAIEVIGSRERYFVPFGFGI